MPVKYLSAEWIDAYNAAVTGDDSVAAAMKGKNAVIQMVIAEAPAGEIRQSYDTAAKVNSGELDGQKAFTQGKVKISGKMLKMMQLRGPLAQVQKALDTIDTEY